jgi:hypothetical protein
MFGNKVLQGVLISMLWIIFIVGRFSPEQIKALQFAALLAVPEQCITLVLATNG